MDKVKEVDECLASLDNHQKTILLNLRNIVKELLPEVEEYIGSGVPAFRYNDKYLISYGATQKHLSLYVTRGNGIKILKNELKKFDTSNTVIRFTPEKPITSELIKRIIDIRRNEIDSPQD